MLILLKQKIQYLDSNYVYKDCVRKMELKKRAATILAIAIRLSRVHKRTVVVNEKTGSNKDIQNF